MPSFRNSWTSRAQMVQFSKLLEVFRNMRWRSNGLFWNYRNGYRQNGGATRDKSTVLNDSKLLRPETTGRNDIKLIRERSPAHDDDTPHWLVRLLRPKWRETIKANIDLRGDMKLMWCETTGWCRWCDDYRHDNVKETLITPTTTTSTRLMPPGGWQ